MTWTCPNCGALPGACIHQYEAEEIKRRLEAGRRIGFTGTQRGMTEMQREFVMDYFARLGTCVLVHGDCVGADSQAHACAVAHGWWTEIHPCTIENKRAHCRGTLIYQPRPPIARNHTIVDTASGMVATPGEKQEQLRSGTWATMRYARKVGRHLVTCWPDGSTSVLRPK